MVEDTPEIAAELHSFGNVADHTNQLLLPFPLRPSARFETFVAGKNKILLDILQTSNNGQDLTAPVWVWGESGCGKTHLLQAFCAATEKKAIYLPLNDLKKSPEILQGLSSLDIVALDDIDIVVGDSDWDQALFSIFNGLWTEGGVLLCSARYSPASLSFSLPDLGSRAAGSSIYQVKGLSDEDSILALRARAQSRGIDLPESSARFLITHVRRDMGTLCLFLESLNRASVLKQRKLTIPFIRDQLD